MRLWCLECVHSSDGPKLKKDPRGKRKEALDTKLPDDLEACLSRDEHADSIEASSFCVSLRESPGLGMLLCLPTA